MYTEKGLGGEHGKTEQVALGGGKKMSSGFHGVGCGMVRTGSKIIQTNEKVLVAPADTQLEVSPLGTCQHEIQRRCQAMAPVVLPLAGMHPAAFAKKTGNERNHISLVQNRRGYFS